MSNVLVSNRFLILRRLTQVAILFLFSGAYLFGWQILRGNLSAAKVLDSFYLADPYASIQMLFAGKLISLDILIGSVIVLGFYALLAGRSFCSWVCPVNIITDLAEFLRKKLKLKGGSRFLKLPRNLRYWIMGLSLVVSLLTGVAAFEYISPVSILHRNIIFGFGMGMWLIVIIFLFDLIVQRHGWCGHVCPLGAFHAAVTPKSGLKVYHEKDKCETGCKDCKTVCPEVQVMSIIGKEDGKITSGECTNCGRCIEVCEQKALSYSLFKK